MLEHIWSVLCRRSVVDSETNNISIYDVFEQLDVDVKAGGQDETVKLINIPIEYEVVNLWLKENNEKSVEAELEIEVINPDGKQGKTFAHKLAMPPGMRRLRSRIKIAGFVVSISGDYIFRVKIKEKGQKNFKIVAHLPLEVNIKRGPEKRQNFSECSRQP